MGWNDDKTDVEKLLDICAELITFIQVDVDHGVAPPTLLQKIADLYADQVKKRQQKAKALADVDSMLVKISEIK